MFNLIKSLFAKTEKATTPARPRINVASNISELMIVSCTTLSQAKAMVNKTNLSEIEKAGAIQKFKNSNGIN